MPVFLMHLCKKIRFYESFLQLVSKMTHKSKKVKEKRKMLCYNKDREGRKTE